MRKDKRTLVFSSKTGTGNSTEVPFRKLCVGQTMRLPVVAKFAMTIGATPTITIALQGLRLADNTWEELATATKTVAGTYYLTSGVPKKRHLYRLSISANTNVTVTSAYIGVGTVQD
jgi:hypothetical protein